MTCNNEKWHDQHVTSMGQRKNLSLQQELNLWPSVHRLDALTIELPRIHDELGCIQGWCMTCLLRTARISISLMILAVCTMHVIYEFCIWSSSPHNTNTSATVSHISNSISGSIFWLVLQKPQYRNRVICFCAYPFNYQIVIVEERRKHTLPQITKVIASSGMNHVIFQLEFLFSNVNGKYHK